LRLWKKNNYFFGRLVLVLVGVAAALPAEGRVRKKRKPSAVVHLIRPEDDPRKRGSSPAFRKASIAFAEPVDLGELGEGPVRIRLVVKAYALGALKPGGPSPHAHLIVDNEPAMEIADADATWTLSGLAAGPHLVRAVLCRPWHEVVKAPKAFAMARFWVGPRLQGKAGRAAESVTWPRPRAPILTYVLPLGIPSPDLKLTREQASDDPRDPAASSDSASAPASPGANRPVLDFYFANGKLGRRGDKVKIVLDRRELPLITDWKPQPLRRVHRGTRRVTIDLLNRRGVKVNNVVNRTDRVFTVPG
jgi:hypothetical protein